MRRLPDGEASFADVFDGDGVLMPGAEADEPFTVRLTIRKRGDEIVADFAGSDGQVAGPMNAPLTVTASGVYCALKMIADPQSLIPPNSGCWRPVTVTAPPGSVVNAQPPAPVVYANHEISHRVADMVMAAMFRISPATVMAASQGTSAVATFGGLDPRTGERYVSYESLKGGFGARPVKDGINAVASTVSNMMNTPVEMLEMSFPLRVEEYALIPDSGGAGTWRGGLGARRVWRVLGHEAHAAVCCERSLTPPFGLAGGRPGCGDASLARIARRQAAAAQQQGRLSRARGQPPRDGSTGLGRLRPARRPRSAAAAGGPRRRLCDRRGCAARLRDRRLTLRSGLDDAAVGSRPLKPISSLRLPWLAHRQFGRSPPWRSGSLAGNGENPPHSTQVLGNSRAL